MRRVPATVVLLALVTAACASTSTQQAQTSPTTGDASTPKTTESASGEDPPAKSSKKKKSTISDDPDEVVNLALDDIEAYWKTEMPKVYDGKAYDPISGGRHPYDSSTPPPACGGQQRTYREQKHNAFYCIPDDLVAWDREDLIPGQLKEFGPFAVAIVFAHEWGHAIQTRGGVSIRTQTIIKENQADCFAGAWAKQAVSGKTKNFTPDPGDLEKGLASLIALRDPVGTNASDESAHGLAFDRVNAFQEGYEDGPKRCREYGEGNPPTPVEMGFSTREDAQRGGNYPYDAFQDKSGNEQPGAAEFVAADLAEYFRRVADGAGLSFGKAPKLAPYTVGNDNPTCDGKQLSDDEATDNVFYCKDRNVIAYDEALMRSVYDSIGDFGVATVLAQQYAVAAQQHAGADTTTVDAQLQQSCLAGAWAGDVAKRAPSSRTGGSGGTGAGDTAAGVTLSPGDLDESVQAFLAFNQGAQDAKVNAFARVSIFRKGFQQGESVCRIGDM